MAKEIDLKKGELSRHVNKAAKAIADGYIIVIPMEHSYAFVCDAFRQDTVRAMHVLRGDPLFTAAQVIVGSSLSGIILLSTFDFILESITVGSFVSFMFARRMSEPLRFALERFEPPISARIRHALEMFALGKYS